MEHPSESTPEAQTAANLANPAAASPAVAPQPDPKPATAPPATGAAQQTRLADGAILLDSPQPFEPIRVGHALDRLGIRNQQFFQSLMFWVHGGMGRIDLAPDGLTLLVEAMDKGPFPFPEDVIIEFVDHFNEERGTRQLRWMTFSDRETLFLHRRVNVAGEFTDAELESRLTEVFAHLWEVLGEAKTQLTNYAAEAEQAAGQTAGQSQESAQ